MSRYLLTAGSYANSNGARSHYAGVLWRPLQWRPASGLLVAAGAAFAAMDGYPAYDNGGWLPRCRCSRSKATGYIR